MSYQKTNYEPAESYNSLMSTPQHKSSVHQKDKQGSIEARSEYWSESRLEPRKESAAGYGGVPSLSLAPNNLSRMRIVGNKDNTSERLSEQVEISYRQHIQELISQNETMKLQHRQAMIRADELQMRLEKLEYSRNDPRIEPQSPLRISLKYQLPLRKVLQPFGFTRDDTNIDQCRSEADIIDFVMKGLSDKADSLRQIQREAREKLAEQQRELGKVRESLKKLMQTNELFKNRENRYKQKAQQMRKKWSDACDQLIQKEQEKQSIENQKQSLENTIQQQDMEIARLKRQTRSAGETHKSIVDELNLELKDKSAMIRELQSQNRELSHSLEEAKQSLSNCQIKEKLKEDELKRAQREATKWKERFDALEKQLANQRKELLFDFSAKKSVSDVPPSKLQPVAEVPNIPAQPPQRYFVTRSNSAELPNSSTMADSRSRQESGTGNAVQQPLEELQVEFNELCATLLKEIEDRQKQVEKHD